MSELTLNAEIQRFPYAAPFRISGHSFTKVDVLFVQLSDGQHIGRGEAAGIHYLNDDSAHMMDQIERVRAKIEAGITREGLRHLLPPGGARCAVDAALWELEATQRGLPVWAYAGLAAPRPLRTTFTLGADDPTAMANGALRYAQARAIKIKLTGELALDIERVRAVRAVRPEVWIGVDANQGFGIGDLPALIEAMQQERVSLIEQPLARGREADLDGFRSPIPLAADESVQGLAELSKAVGRFDLINIKLDKCGGLTEALMMATEARKLGFGLMVGNMIASSLAMAPAFLLGQQCEVVDLDGPIFLREDREPGLVYRDGDVWADEAVWGAGGQFTA